MIDSITSTIHSLQSKEVITILISIAALGISIWAAFVASKTNTLSERFKVAELRAAYARDHQAAALKLESTPP